MRTVTVTYQLVGKPENRVQNVSLGPVPGSKHVTTEADIPKIIGNALGLPATAVLVQGVSK